MNRTPAVTLLALLVVGGLALSAAGPAAAQPVPARPEELRFPPLKYTPPRAADHRVVLAGGIPAYLVPDRAFPMVTVIVLTRVGPDLDPAGKEGLAATMMTLLTRSGTAQLTAEQLEERVAFLGARLESGIGGGGGMMGLGGVPIGGTEARVSVNLLSKDLDEGLALLTGCLKGAAFQADRLQIEADRQVQDMKQRNDATADLETREWGFLMNGEGHWSNRHPTEASVRSITREDLAAMRARYLGPRNFVLAVVGDFDRAAMVKKLNAVFAGWPSPGVNPGPPPPPAAPAKPGWYVVDKDVNQTRVTFGLPALDRYDPDFPAAQVMNHVLGGGSFTSRIVNRIRSDEGLAYSVNSRLEGGAYHPGAWRTAFQTKARSTAFAISIGLEEIARIRDSLVTAGELETARNSFVEGFPARFPTLQAVAGALAAEELTGRYRRDPRYFAEFTKRITAVTAADVQRVARRLLDPAKMTFLMVGSAKEMALPDGKHEVTLASLVGGEPQRLPLRDPLTMKPMP